MINLSMKIILLTNWNNYCFLLTWYTSRSIVGKLSKSAVTPLLQSHANLSSRNPAIRISPSNNFKRNERGNFDAFKTGDRYCCNLKLQPRVTRLNFASLGLYGNYVILENSLMEIGSSGRMKKEKSLFATSTNVLNI